MNGPAAEADDLHQQARRLLSDAQDGDPQLRRDAVLAMEPLLDRARVVDLEPEELARLLRIGVLVRNMADDPARPVDPLLEELVSHALAHRLVEFEGGAHALRGQIMLSRGRSDTALESAASALVALDGTEASYQRGMVFTDVGILLVHLGLEDEAEPLLERAHSDITAHGQARHRVISASNRVHTAVLHGLALERAAQPAAAAERYRAAAVWAVDGLADWEVLAGSGRCPLGEEYTAELRAALALADIARVDPQLPEQPAALRAQLPALRALLPGLRRTDRRAMVGIALARLLARDGQTGSALEVLTDVAESAPDRDVERVLQLAAVREIAALRVGLNADDDSADPLRVYLQQVEAELWAMRRSRAEALRSRLEGERLRREHGRLSAEAAQDPLTGLANRRAMHDRLERLLLPGPARSWVALALIDLDGLKGVNDARSHGDGDTALRAVAAAMAGAVRADDLVTRYGGDEFVLVMPGTKPREALAAVQRVVEAIRTLPVEASFGVTASAGLVAVPPGARTAPEWLLDQADTAMYRAKQAGGNQVASATM